MLQKPNYSISIFIVLIYTFLFQIVLPCSFVQHYRPPTITEKTVYAEKIIYGKAIQTFQEERFHSTSYTAEFEAICSIKGYGLQRKIVNLTGAGFVPGMCHASDLRPRLVNGKPVYVFVYVYEGETLMVADEELESNEENVRQIKQACGLEPLLPAELEDDDFTLESAGCPILVGTSKPGCEDMEDIKKRKMEEKEARDNRPMLIPREELETASVLVNTSD